MAYRNREDRDEYLTAQFAKLQTDHIDYYLVYPLVGDLWDAVEKQGVREFLEAAKRDGRMRNAGFSFHGAFEDFSRILCGELRWQSRCSSIHKNANRKIIVF
jgi:predicted aldo/keto reductase-like oxidoreductase